MHTYMYDIQTLQMSSSGPVYSCRDFVGSFVVLSPRMCGSNPYSQSPQGDGPLSHSHST